jgi:hypothetical protein
MKTLHRIAVGTVCGLALLALAPPADAGHVSIGGGIVFGGSSEHTAWQIGIGTGGLGLGIAVGGGYRCAPAPVVVPCPPVVVPSPVVVVHRPVVCTPVVVPQPVVYAPVVATAPPPVVWRPRVIHYVNANRRIAQRMVHGVAAVIEERRCVGYPWIVVGEHESIW